MSDILKNLLDFFSNLFEKFPHLLSSKYFWICFSVFGWVSVLLIYFSN